MGLPSRINVSNLLNCTSQFSFKASKQHPLSGFINKENPLLNVHQQWEIENNM